DRRRVLVEPVPEGLDRVAGFYDPLVERHRADLAELGPGELATLLRFMERAESSTEAEIRSL
ncbi:MAG: MarR family transcriptional regulator, partial [Pseudonocardia sediminis]